MSIIQTFYNNLAPHYDKLFLDWKSSAREQALILNEIFLENNFDSTAKILDCACGIGTQSIGLAELGYSVIASDISEGELIEAKRRGGESKVDILFKKADFCSLSEVFSDKFDIVIAIDNALPHMLTSDALNVAVKSIANQIAEGGIFVASIRDYDRLLEDKPLYSPPYIHKTAKGQRVSFQTWEWAGENYKLIQYIIDDEEVPQVHRFECEYRATRRDELAELLHLHGFYDVSWKFPDETGFYQPIVVARR